MVSKADCLKLKVYGFMWYKEQTTDRVPAEDIADVIPAANGFTVLYSDKSVLKASTAQVEKIEFPEDDKLMSIWTCVHWIDIKDERR